MITHITIEIDGKEFKLTPEKAERLYNELHKLYGLKGVQIGPYIAPTQPYKHPWEQLPIMWGSGTTTINKVVLP